MGPGDLKQILTGLCLPADERLLAGMNPADDAGVFLLDERTALVLTLDFFTPIADDPYTFGAIAAANALSDVYAMAGQPLAVLNICCFPPAADKEMLRQILQGAADKTAEAGAVVAGGHTVRDQDLKFGLAVIGRVHPKKLLAKAGARPGDVLVLTKPLGTALLATARRKDAISEDEFAPALVVMTELNRRAAEALLGVSAHACTDITGFALVGHAHEMAEASGVSIAFNLSSLPLLPGARECAAAGHICSGSRANRSHFSPWVEGELDELWAALIFDPQTSGGLLISLPPAQASHLLEKLSSLPAPTSCPRTLLSSPPAPAIIGEVLAGPPGKIILRP